ARVQAVSLRARAGQYSRPDRGIAQDGADIAGHVRDRLSIPRWRGSEPGHRGVGLQQRRSAGHRARECAQAAAARQGRVSRSAMGERPMRLRMRWRKVAALAASLVSLGSATPAWPQYPGKPVRVIVPFAAGGTPDVVGRIVSQQLAAQTGQAVVVENRPGAGGVVGAQTVAGGTRVGAQTVAEARPDGYTLLIPSSSSVVNPSFHKKLPFDVVRDFEPVSNLALTEAYILGVNSGLPVRTVQELIALARRSDSKISFGSPGVGNGLHLAAELFKSLTRTQMVHVPSRGAAPAITGLIAGDVQVMFMTPPSSLPFIEGKKIRALGYTGAKRFGRLPDVPTMA